MEQDLPSIIERMRVVKSPMLLWKELAKEFGERCQVSTHRSINTAAAREKTEGLEFFTLALPVFAKAFDKALDRGHSDPSSYTGFKCRGKTPLFLGEFFDQIFSRETGVMFDEPSVDAVLAIRQLTRLMSKIELPCSERRTSEALRGFVETDQELETAIESLSLEEIQAFGRMAARLFGDLFAGMDSLHSYGELVPKHGPGSTADRLLGNEKYDLRRARWHWRLEHAGFHSVDFLLPNSRYWKDLERVPFLKPGDEPPVRVVTVPKTPATPRIIAIEPVCMQYTQQAVLEAMIQLWTRDKLLSEFFTPDSQKPNRVMARKGSFTGSLATIDLSEASDRVSAELVWEMASYSVSIQDMLFATRSSKAQVPGHGVILLAKYASMGSALCFMVEVMVFLTIIFLAIQKQEGRQLRQTDIKRFAGKLRVFGDDIIVPSDYAEGVMEALETYGLKVNLNKSYWEGNFRESCGKEFFRGYDVSIVKLRTLFPSSTQDARECISTVSFRNQLDLAGFGPTVEFLDEHLLKVLNGHFPWVRETSPVLGRVDHHGGFYEVSKVSPTTFVPLARGYKVRSNLPFNPLDGRDALLKTFLKRGELPFADRNHLQRSGRPRVVGIKLGYGPVF
jgi:hypothetical protein